LSGIENYSGQTVAFLRESQDGPGYSEVYTSIVQEDAQPISVNYRMKQTDSGWKVYDVLVDGISLVGNYRNQFNRVINDKGYEFLVDRIRMKAEQAGAETSGS
jgi:phospholipid transport system substrate-binding protein